MKQNIEFLNSHSDNTIISKTKFKPMLFSMPMVQAVLEGKKTETRRLKGLQNIDAKATEIIANNGWPKQGNFTARFQFKDIKTDGVEAWEITNILKSPVKIGDVIWVRETWNTREGEFVYKASPNLFKQTNWYKEIENAFRIVSLEVPEPENCIQWKPSLFMPKNACRLFLEVTDIRAERLQNISEQDAIAEGVINLEGTILWYNYIQDRYTCGSAIESYKSLWQKINGIESWDLNSSVWVITFKVVKCPQGFC